jgi:hypothetical protein
MQKTRAEWLTMMLHDATFHCLLCVAFALLFGTWLFIVMRRRDLWLRYTAAEAAFFHRLGFPPRRLTDASRQFTESRGFTYTLCFFVVAFLLLSLCYAGLYVYFAHTFHSTPSI